MGDSHAIWSVELSSVASVVEFSQSINRSSHTQPWISVSFQSPRECQLLSSLLLCRIQTEWECPSKCLRVPPDKLQATKKEKQKPPLAATASTTINTRAHCSQQAEQRRVELSRQPSISDTPGGVEIVPWAAVSSLWFSSNYSFFSPQLANQLAHLNPLELVL